MLRDWTGDWIGTFLGHKGAVWSSKLSHDTTLAVTASADFTAKVWDTYNGTCIHTLPHQHIVRSAAISPDGSHILTGGHERLLRLFDLSAPEQSTFLQTSDQDSSAHSSTIKSVLWQDAAMAVSGSEDGTLKWWDLRSKRSFQVYQLDSPLVYLEWSAGAHMMVAVAGNTVYFFNAKQPGQVIKQFNLKHKPSCASLHPIVMDKFVVGSADDTWVRIYDFNSGNELDCFKGHHGPVHAVEYSPDGEYFASGSEDGTIRLWQTNPGRAYGLWRAN
ncbi:WD40 repeat-like protein [Wallemia mellicola]|nr:hypothetical protein E3Q24_01256 [Wallemia mellicola]TIB82187.1 WD40 repeat-like protein [Wallemia mellicola]TIB87721.1 WD40 repeat-like protein [Wallemia mellicola]TIB90646.1 WD40 repeat-like protein [Wallemia mellicola]TIB93791.1 WD40 repeat-like protein [Wallemia mellicola]